MAEKKISELTAKGAAVAATDLMVISEVSGASYVTKSVTGANIKALVTDANMTTSDITTNDVSTAKHGFAPKAPNDTAKFLRGDGTWAVPSAGGLTKFTEAETTAAPNGTVYVDSLTAAASTTNADAAFIPKGTGAILAAIPDNTATGGNKRGANSVDLQTSRVYSTSVASGTSSVAIGYDNRAAGNNSVSIGNSCRADGNNSLAMGDNSITTSGTNFSIGTGGTASGGFGAVSLGRGNTASGDGTLASGFGNTASGSRSISLGESNTASALTAVAIGFTNVANAANSLALGSQSNTFSIIGRQTYSSGQEGTSGDAQASKFILRERTTGNTATTITTNSSAASTNNQVILSNQSAYRFKGSIVGKQSGSVNAAVWDIDGFIVRGANAAATTLNVSNVTLVQNTPAWGTPTLAADTTNGGLQVQVTGAAATNIQWTAVIDTTEVIYA